jgi:hypothetical protein
MGFLAIWGLLLGWDMSLDSWSILEADSRIKQENYGFFQKMPVQQGLDLTPLI